MPAKLTTGSGAVLVIAGRVWSSTDAPELADSLNRDFDVGLAAGLPGNPDPDWTEARRVQAILGGEITDHMPERETPAADGILPVY